MVNCQKNKSALAWVRHEAKLSHPFWSKESTLGDIMLKINLFHY
jgi:hypothetical protein